MSIIVPTVLTAIALILTVAAVLFAVVIAATYVITLLKRTPLKPQESTTLSTLLGTPDHTIYR